MKKDLVLGIDPGLGHSHGALLSVPADGLFPPHAPRYRPVGFLKLATPEDDHAWPELVPVELAQRVAFVAVESARGSIIAARSADPVLRNACMSGRIQAVAACELGCPVGSVPALGTDQGWNWRAALGCAGQTDVGVRTVTERRIEGGEGAFPRNRRGNIDSHYVDAAGIAAAALDRLLGSDKTLPADPDELVRRWYAVRDAERLTLEANKNKRAGRKKARALRGKYLK